MRTPIPNSRSGTRCHEITPTAGKIQSLLLCGTVPSIPELGFGSGYAHWRPIYGNRPPVKLSARQADTIVRSGQADLVVMAREFLRQPYYPLLAARQFGQEALWPKQYERAK